METAQQSPGSRSRARRILVVGAVGGIAAGMMMAAVVMLYGFVSESRSVWDAPMAIAAWVFGGEHFTRNEPGEHVAPVLLGLAGHMMNSVAVGVVFAALMAAVRPRGFRGAVVAGTLYGLAVWVVMRYIVLPANDGEAAMFTTDLVAPQWVWWLAHAALGMTAGIVNAVAETRSRRLSRQPRPVSGIVRRAA